MNTLKILGICFLLSEMILINYSCNQELVSDDGWKLIGWGFNFPEGPAWDGKETLYLSNCYGDWITRMYNDQMDTLVTSSDITFLG